MLRCLSAASTAPGSAAVESATTVESAPAVESATAAAGKAPVTVHLDAAALTHTSEGAVIASSGRQTPISDPIGAALRGHLTSRAYRRFSLTRTGRATSGIAWTDPAGSALRGYTSATAGSSLTWLARSGQTLLAGATLSEIVEPLLRLANSGPGSRLHSRPALETVRDVTVVIRHARAMSWIVNPVIAVTDIYPIEVVALDEVVVDHDIVAAAPTEAPSPASPTAAPDRAYRNPCSK
jgi:hypothetical protein